MTPARPRHRAPDPGDRGARYRQWATHLEGVRADYLRRTPLYRLGFLALTAAGFACFALGTFAGIWGAASASLVSVCGLAMLRVRVWEIDVELRETRAEISRLTRATPDAPPKAAP